MVLLAGCTVSERTKLRETFPAKPSPQETAFRVDPAQLGPGERLAFVREGRLFVMEQGKELVKVDAAGAASPRWSRDGTWLAYLEGSGGQEAGRVARLVGADGAAPRDAQGLPRRVQDLRWSPAGNRFAATVEEPEGAPPSLWVGEPGADARRVATAEDGIHSFAWRPDGRALAYAATAQTKEPRADKLMVLPIDGGAGAPVTEFTAGTDEGVIVAGWWPDGKGILFWPNPQHAASGSADGLQLQSLAVGSHSPKGLTGTLTYPEWLSWADERRVLLVAGFGREVWKSKALAFCHAGSGGCQNLPNPDGTVALDPAWSPKGDRIAFVQAAEDEGGNPSEWVKTRTLWIASPDGTGARRIDGAGTGVFGPLWDAGGGRVLYVAGGELRIQQADSSEPPATVVESFPGPRGVVDDALPWYYGHLAVPDLLDWWRG
jgi:TolB protein